MHPKIKVKSDEILYAGKYLTLIRRHFLDRKGNPKFWEMTHRRIYGNVVFVVPITSKKEIILEKIYRIPLKSYALELCAGLTDRKGEKEIDTAQRELLEETGYAAGRFIKLAEGYTDTGRAAEKLVFYLAQNAGKVGEPKPEDSEDIEVIKIPLVKLPRLLSNPPNGMEIDLKIWAVWGILEEKGYA